MNRRQTLSLGALGAVVVAVLLALIWWPRSSSPESSEPGTNSLEVNEEEVVTLFFPGVGRNLEEEERKITAKLFPEEKAHRILQELIAGPQREELYSPLPSEVEVRGTYAGRDQTLYVDLHRPENGPPPAAGSLNERLMVYSLVNSIVANVDGVERVAVLWNGNQPASLSGHLDNGKPLSANLGLVAANP